jgi:hypothetical protein
MRTKRGFSEYVRSGRAVLESGISGLSRGEDSYLQGQPLSAVLAAPARNSLRIGLIGACIGLLRLSREPRSKRLVKGIFYGTVGSAIGFCAGFIWNTRQLTGTMARSALHQVDNTRDNLWLERHPIDYA